MSGTVEEPPARQSRDDRRSPVFDILIAVFLALAVLMLWQPGLARAAAFPFVLCGYLISLCLHEFGHALVAYYCGDTTVRDKGYLTLNPLRYTNLQYSIVLPLLYLALGGIGFPGAAVYIDTRLLRAPWQDALVSAAGPLATALVLALLLLVLNAADDVLAGAPVLRASLAFLALLEVTTLVLSLIPCPGFDGWGVIQHVLPDAVRQAGRRLAAVAPLMVMLALFLVPEFNRMFWDAVFGICGGIGLDARLALRGFQLFRFWR
jgi:Zn-dependent protease